MIFLSTVFGVLRATDGEGKLPRWIMCWFMAGVWGMSHNTLLLFVMFPALLWAYSYGWALDHNRDAIEDWGNKFGPSGDFLILCAEKGITNNRVLHALGWLPRIFMTFWLPLAIADKLVWLPVLCVGWGLAYYVAGFWKNKRATRLAEMISADLLGAVLLN